MDTQGFQRLQGVSMGFLAGYVDTLGFAALFGLFTAHVTGNFILFAVALAAPGHTPGVLKLLAFPAFILGVAACRLLIAGCERRGLSATKPSYALQLALLLGFMVCGVLAEPLGTAADGMAIAAGMLGAAAMGAHGATSKLLLNHLAPTSMMTGNVTQLVIDTVDRLRGAADAATRARSSKFFWQIVAFALGCGAAAFAYFAFGFAALLVPAAILGLHLYLPEPTAAPTVIKAA
ncbi:membrane protein [Massilia sp. WF1]|uniref:YoaK family protein n=1 Tax=unclassified Massilia TaxID=2609279 RepID=UPI00068FD097|nr:MULTISPECIES: YoaK family protein [unclassified Massilia]ALK95295.1 hypothetical protein AM586_02295 [Massilia sp. WG5]KNZ67373.1 membrane protein [Massilia sp. WF1]